MVTFPAEEHHRPSTSTRLYCLVTDAHRCEELAHAQGCYAVLSHWELDPQPIDRKSNALPLRHWLFYVCVLAVDADSSAIDSLVNIKERELALALMRVAELTRQLEQLHHGQLDGILVDSTSTHAKLLDRNPEV